MHFIEALEEELQDNHQTLLWDWHILCSSELLMEGPDWTRMNVKCLVWWRDFCSFQFKEEGKKNPNQNRMSMEVKCQRKKNNYLRWDIDKGLVPLEGMIQKINEIDVPCLLFVAPVILLVPVACYIFSLIQSGGKQLIWHDKLIVSEAISALKHVSCD